MEMEYNGYKIVGSPGEVKEFLGFLVKKGKTAESTVLKGKNVKVKPNTNWKNILGKELIVLIKEKFELDNDVRAREIYNDALDLAASNGYAVSTLLRKRMLSSIWNALARCRTDKRNFDVQEPPAEGAAVSEE